MYNASLIVLIGNATVKLWLKLTIYNLNS